MQTEVRRKRAAVQAALNEYLAPGGLSRNEAAKKYGISPSSLAKAMKRAGRSLSPEEIHIRKSRGGRSHGPPGSAFRSPKCPEGCNCNRHKRGHKAEIILGRKNCTSCGRFLYLLEYHVRERDEHGKPANWQSNCKSCQRKRSRISKGILRRGVPYEERKSGMTRAEKNAHRRALHSEKMKQHGYRENKREYARIYAEAKRREAGIPSRNFKNKTLPGLGELMPVEPLATWIEKKLNNGYVGNVKRLAAKCGVDHRVISRIRSLEHPRVSEDLADKILISEGSTDLWEVYPHLYSEL